MTTLQILIRSIEQDPTIIDDLLADWEGHEGDPEVQQAFNELREQRKKPIIIADIRERT